MIAIFAFLAAMVIGFGIIWRRLPRASEAAVGEPFCIACGTPASQFSAESFSCPQCGRDARELGLAAIKPLAKVDPFWRLVGFSAVLCLLALISAAALLAALRQTSEVSIESTYWGDGTVYQRFSVTADGNWKSNGQFEGELNADLYTLEGKLRTLEVRCPSLHYEVMDDTGRALVGQSGDKFDYSAVLQWMRAAKLDPDTPGVQAEARRAYYQVCQTLKLTPEPLPTPQTTSLMTSGSSSDSMISGSSGYSGSAHAPASVMPASLIAWSLAWLVGTWLILRPRRPQSPSGEGGGAR